MEGALANLDYSRLQPVSAEKYSKQEGRSGQIVSFELTSQESRVKYMNNRSIARVGNFSLNNPLSLSGQSQMERCELARGSWRQGQFHNAQIVLSTVLAEDMSPAVWVECWQAQAAFCADLKDYSGSLNALDRAAEHLDEATERTKGLFHNQRARIHKEFGNYDAASVDYAGAVFWLEQSGDREQLGMVFNNEAGLYLKREDIRAARQRIDEAIPLLSPDGTIIDQALDTEASILLEEGEPGKALIRIEQAITHTQNEEWKAGFLATRQKVYQALILETIKTDKDIENLRVDLIKRALIEHQGAVTPAADSIGMGHRTLSYVVDHDESLRQFRKPPRIRRKTLITKT